MYRLMCQKQACFRARVSPKPWRIGIDQRLKPRPGVWPIDPARLPERRAWVAAYDRAVATKAAENPLFKEIQASQVKCAQRVVRWHLDTQVGQRMAFDHYFGKAAKKT